MKRIVYAFGLALASQKTTDGVDKVIKMLQETSDKVQKGGREEAKAFEDYACWCKNTGDEKREAISNAEADLTDLTSQIGGYTQDMNDAHDAIQTLQSSEETTAFDESIPRKELEIKNAQDAFKTAEKGRLEEIAAIQKDVTALEDAILTLRSSDLSLAQTQSLLQTIKEVPTQVYHFASADEIIPELENIKHQAKDDLQTAEANNIEEQQLHATEMQTMKQELVNLRTDLMNQKEKHAEASDSLAVATRQFTQKSAQKDEDQEYLTEITEACDEKAKEYHEREADRLKEITAFADALHAMETVKEKHDAIADRDAGTALAATKKAQAIPAIKPKKIPVSDKKTAAHEEHEKKSPASFLQVAQSVAFMAKPDALQKIRDMIAAAGTKLKSPTLSTLAQHMRQNPNGHFDKVIELIRQLIAKMQNDILDDTDHHAYCTKELADIKVTRDANAQNLQKTRAEVSKNWNKRELAIKDLIRFKTEKKLLQLEFLRAKDIKDEEVQDASDTIQDAKDGIIAIKEALRIMREMYNELKTESLLQVQQPAGGEMKGSYQGSGSGNSILELLDMIKGDLEQTLTTTQQFKQETNKMFGEFKAENKNAQKKKQQGANAMTTDIATFTQNVNDGVRKAENFNNDLQIALASWAAIRKACVDTGVSYEEREAKRQQEIKALKEALEALDNISKA